MRQGGLAQGHLLGDSGGGAWGVSGSQVPRGPRLLETGGSGLFQHGLSVRDGAGKPYTQEAGGSKSVLTVTI